MGTKFRCLLSSLLLSALLFFTTAYSSAETLLTPEDFGLTLNQYHQINIQSLPPDILVDCFNGDKYPDIARFTGNRVEIYLNAGWGYYPEPQMVKYFDRNIVSMRLEGIIWLGYSDIVVTLSDGTEERIVNSGSGLMIDPEPHPFAKSGPPHFVRDVDFQLVWESEGRPNAMDNIAVGDIDNDGIIELVTWYKLEENADTAWILIYKCVGDDQYELFMEERFFTDNPNNTALSYMLITDFDQNGQKEICYTYDKPYIWEFSAPGEYTFYECTYPFSRAVADAKVCDVDQDGNLELAVVCRNSGFQPPCIYQVSEYGGKTSTHFLFYSITGMWQDWIDSRLDVGDFDNDGVIDIVAGNAGYVWSYDPVDIHYFRYDSTVTYNFNEYWLQTGVASSCVTPVIEDFDNDGMNELFAGGLCYEGGSAYIYEGTELGIGSVTWRDTTTMIFGPNESAYGFVDEIPSIISTVIYWTTQNNTFLYLLNANNSEYHFIWESNLIDSAFCENPYLVDVDFDNEMNILLAVSGYGTLPRYAMSWEQVSNQIGDFQNEHFPYEIRLNACYPNPFNSITKIKFTINKSDKISIYIYDLQGRKADEIISAEFSPGEHLIEWNADNLTSGIYFVNLRSKTGYHQTIKSLLIK